MGWKLRFLNNTKQKYLLQLHFTYTTQLINTTVATASLVN